MKETAKGGKRKSVTDKDRLVKSSKENKVELSEDELKRVSGGFKTDYKQT
jgi:bacteriocin-like protein